LSRERFFRLRLPAEITRGLPGILVSAQAAVFFERAELAEAYSAPLAKAAPFGRFFWGPAGIFPFGPVSRVLGELALLRGDEGRALEHFDAAIAECREMGTVPFLEICEKARAKVGGQTAPARPIRNGRTEASLVVSREGDVWTVSTQRGAPFRVKHAKGMEYLHHLLRSPGREVYLLVRVGADQAPEDAGAVLDDRAKQAYRPLVEDLEDQLQQDRKVARIGIGV
jgi:hypothetical protein